MTIHEAYQRLVFQLYHIYDNREAANIADLVMEYLTGWKKIDRLLNKQVPLTPGNMELLEKYTRDLLASMPVQYVLHEAWFYGMKLYVDENVLIPRPETAELVEWIVKTIGSEKSPTNIVSLAKSMQLTLNTNHGIENLTFFDIGTGSGCIALALKRALPFAMVYACDINKKTLAVAEKNAAGLQIDVGWLHLNFLDPAQWENLPFFNIIASNPPYIPASSKETMHANVIEYEPHLALFVENNDPLLFYRSIVDFGEKKLMPGGSIYVEIHEDFANDVWQLFTEKGYSSIELRKDMQGKDRMIRANKI